MKPLATAQCEACDINAKSLTEAEINKLLIPISDWQLVIESSIQKLRRIFITKNYIQSMHFTNAIAEIAEKENHHPHLIVEYSSVTVTWWSHKIKGLHKNDFIMAAKTNELFIPVINVDKLTSNPKK